MVTGTTAKAGSHTQPHPQALDTFFPPGHTLQVRIGDRSPGSQPLSSHCVHKTPSESLFCKPMWAAEREKEKQDASDSKFFQA